LKKKEDIKETDKDLIRKLLNIKEIDKEYSNVVNEFYETV